MNTHSLNIFKNHIHSSNAIEHKTKDSLTASETQKAREIPLFSPDNIEADERVKKKSP